MESPFLVICISHPFGLVIHLLLLHVSSHFPSILSPLPLQSLGMWDDAWLDWLWSNQTLDSCWVGALIKVPFFIRLFCPAADYQKICQNLLCLRSLSIYQIGLKWTNGFHHYQESVEIQGGHRSLVSLG